MKKAIVLVSFGTVRPGGAFSNVDVLAEMAAQRWPGRSVYQAYTSDVIRCRLANQNVRVFSVPEMLEHLCAEGYEEVHIAPVLLSFGSEYEKIVCGTTPFLDRFRKLTLSVPLLAVHRRRQELALMLSERFECSATGSAFLLVGHGAHVMGNEPYELLRQDFKQLSREDIYTAVLVGEPGIANTIEQMKRDQIRHVCLAALLLTAGKHAAQDLFGEGPDSCRFRLEQAGLHTQCRAGGLLDDSRVVQLYLDHFETTLGQ